MRTKQSLAAAGLLLCAMAHAQNTELNPDMNIFIGFQHCQRTVPGNVFGETPKTATGTVALPIANAVRFIGLRPARPRASGSPQIDSD